MMVASIAGGYGILPDGQCSLMKIDRVAKMGDSGRSTSSSNPTGYGLDSCILFHKQPRSIHMTLKQECSNNELFLKWERNPVRLSYIH